MKITDVSAILLDFPLEKEIQDKTHSNPILEIILVKIKTDEGLIGSSYVYTDGFGGSSIAKMINDDVRDYIIGKEAENITKITEGLFWEFRHVGYGGVTSLSFAGIEIALWDIYSKNLGKPLVELFGKVKDCIPIYSSEAAFRSFSLSEQIKRMKRLRDEGFIGVKMQGGRENPEEDIERVKKVREAIGPKPGIVIDANTLWDPHQAIYVGKKIRDYNILWMEEPIDVRDIEGHKEISKKIDIPVATGEALFTLNDFTEYIKNRAISYINPEVTRVGGIIEWLKIANLAAAFNVKILPHFIPELHTQLLCTIPNSLYVEYFPWLTNHFKEPALVKEGLSYPRTKPGLGLEFKESSIRKFIRKDYKDKLKEWF